MNEGNRITVFVLLMGLAYVLYIHQKNNIILQERLNNKKIKNKIMNKQNKNKTNMDLENISQMSVSDIETGYNQDSIASDSLSFMDNNSNFDMFE